MNDKIRWSVTPAKAVDDNRISDTAFRTLAVLGMYTDRDGMCYPSMNLIAKSRGMSRQAVQKHIKELEALGYIKKYARKTKKGDSSNKYLVKFDFPPATSEVAPLQPQKLHPPATSEVAQNDKSSLTNHINDKTGNEARPISGKRRIYYDTFNLQFAPEIAHLCSLSIKNGTRRICFEAAEAMRTGINPPKAPEDLYPFFAKGGTIYREWPWRDGGSLKPMDIVKHWPRLSGAVQPPEVERKKRVYAEEV